MVPLHVYRTMELRRRLTAHTLALPTPNPTPNPPGPSMSRTDSSTTKSDCSNHDAKFQLDTKIGRAEGDAWLTESTRLHLELDRLHAEWDAWRAESTRLRLELDRLNAEKPRLAILPGVAALDIDTLVRSDYRDLASLDAEQGLRK